MFWPGLILLAKLDINIPVNTKVPSYLPCRITQIGPGHYYQILILNTKYQNKKSIKIPNNKITPKEFFKMLNFFLKNRYFWTMKT